MLLTAGLLTAGLIALSRTATRASRRLDGVKVHGEKGKPGFRVAIDEGEIACFRRRWPASDLDDLRRVVADFGSNGDLEDLSCNKGGSCERWDGSALLALVDDMQCAGEARLGLKDRCHSDEWLHCMRD